MTLPIQTPVEPMEARSVAEIPAGEGWQYEPKWDGFRCLAFRDGDSVELQSKAGQSLTRYFPEVAAAVAALKPSQLVIDGEIVVPIDGASSFDALLQRIHPAASRVKKLSAETPAIYIIFDLLVDDRGNSLMDKPLSDRRRKLEALAKKHFTGEGIRLSPAASDLPQARRWHESLGGGLDGIIAKRTDSPYCAGSRDCVVKIKHQLTADCVVAGFRYASKGGGIGSMLLGLYDDEGLLHHVGFTSSMPAKQKAELKPKLEKLRKPVTEGGGFTGRAPGGPSRWSTERSSQWEPLAPELVIEVRYDHFSGDRFRHGTTLVRWRPDKLPRQCTMEQVIASGRSSLELLK